MSVAISAPISSPHHIGVKRQKRWGEALIKASLFFCALLSVLTTLGIISVLLVESVSFFREVPVLDFVLGTQWTPLFDPRSFGVLPLVCGTSLVALGAAIVDWNS